jgi:hypothetical protein
VGVEFATVVIIRDIYVLSSPVACKIRLLVWLFICNKAGTLTLNLNIHRRLDEMSRVDGAIGNDSSTISCLGTVGHNNGLNVADKGVGSRFRRTEDTEIIDT